MRKLVVPKSSNCLSEVIIAQPKLSHNLNRNMCIRGRMLPINKLTFFKEKEVHFL